MFSNIISKFKRKQKKESFYNLNYNNFDESKTKKVENIDELVDALLAKVNFNPYIKISNAKIILRIKEGLSIKKLLSFTITFLLLFAIIASASSLVGSDNASDDFLGSSNNDFSIENSTSQTNEIGVFSVLNLTLWSDKDVYSLNESVLISGNVLYNNTLVNSTINLLIIGPDYNSSFNLDALDGRFDFEFVPVVVGNYVILVSAIYLNNSISEKIGFYVLEKTLEDTNIKTSYLSVWDDSDYQKKYKEHQITFYANFSSDNQSIENASSLIYFNVGEWTEPLIMNYNEGLYIYNCSFNIPGTHEFRVQCTAPGFESKTIIDEFVVSEIVRDVFIEDIHEHEQVYVLPGASFYVERTINITQSLEAVFAPLYSDGLTIEKFEFISENIVDGEKVLERVLSPQVFSAGNGVSIVEKRIDILRKDLPDDVKQLNHISYSKMLSSNGSITIRIWFRAPSWDDIKLGVEPSSGHISYLTFTENSYDFESSTWWSSNWGKRKLITVNSSQVEANLTNFPILINITDADLASYAQDDGDDIAFVLYSDNTTQLKHQIELFNGTTGNLFAWVNVASLSSSVDTKIWMYYNNSICSNQQNITGTWNSNFVMVQHLNETSGNHQDSTSINNDATTTSVTTQGSAIGKVDGADGYAVGGSDYIQVGTTNWTAGQGTIELWAYPTDFSTNLYFIGHTTQPVYNNRIQLYTDDTVGNLDLGLGNSHTVATNIYDLNVNTWYHIVLTWDGSNYNVYVNGNSVSSGGYSGFSTIHTMAHIGNNGYSASNQAFDGIIDEVRVSNTNRTSGWIKTCYNNQNNQSTFINIDNEENITNTSVDIISPYIIAYSPFIITTTGASGLDNITLFYRYSMDNSSWDSYVSWNNISNPDIEFPWQWNFDFPNGTGYYEFYSIGNKSGYQDEILPDIADAICYFNESLNCIPDIVIINPQPNGTIGVSPQPTCQVWANDSDGDTLTVYWYENTTGSWILRNINNSISADTIVSYNFTQFINYSTTFWWKVAVNDSTDNASKWFYFTTREIYTSVDNISPYIVTSSPFEISASGDSDLDNVTLYYRWSDDNSSWSHSGETIYDTPTIDNIASETNNVDVNSMSWTHTVSSGLNNSILIVGTNVEHYNTGDNYYVASADYNNRALSRADRIAAVTVGLAADISEIWYLLNPDAGSFTVRVNFSVTVNYALGGSASFSNVKQSAPYNTSTTTSISSPTGLATSVNTQVANSLMIAVATDGQGTFVYSYGSNQTQIYDVSSSTHEGAGSRKLSASSGSSTMYTNLSGASNRMSQVVAAWTPFSFTWGNGSNWIQWNNASNPDSSIPWNWGFDFPNGSGFYEYYSIGKKSSSPNESTPSSADARCRYNRLPIITNEIPGNGSTNNQLVSQLCISINDLDGDGMNITWYSNSSGSWQAFGGNNSLSNGTYYQTNSNFSGPGTVYWWYVSVYDGVNTNSSDSFHFITSFEPVLSNPFPINGSSAHYITPVCNVTVLDVDGGSVTVSFYENTTGAWVLKQTNTSVDVTNPANIFWNNYSNATQDYTIYWWKVNVSDGKGCFADEIYHFTTANTSIDITPDRWDQGVLQVGSSNETTGFYFNLTNNGDVPLYIQIKASNATNATTGAKWILNTTSNYDNFTLQYNKSSGGVWTTINLTYDLFISNLVTGIGQTFDLKLIMATMSSTADPLSMDLTFRSIKA